jgi:nitronate monooxygenase
MTAMDSSLESVYPWIKLPLIISAPMFPMSCPRLALSVSKAGGLGFITGGLDAASLKKSLQETVELVKQIQPPIKSEKDTLPIGVGFLLFGNVLNEILPLIKEHVPAAVWLFAPRQLADYVSWTTAIREATQGKTKIWFQVGSSNDAIQITKTCQPDALVIQGADAGGHGLRRSAGLISLFPEVSDNLVAEGMEHVPLFAAGGVAEGRGFLAALALGASGVAMGTRFLASDEALIPRGYRDAVINVKSGATGTIRSELFDKLRGPNIWPQGYDGRAVINKTYVDAEEGMRLDENAQLYAEALQNDLQQYPESDQMPIGAGRLTMWAGSGVGLVRQVLPAADIVDQTREELSDRLRKLSTRYLEQRDG